MWPLNLCSCWPPLVPPALLAPSAIFRASHQDLLPQDLHTGSSLCLECSSRPSFMEFMLPVPQVLLGSGSAPAESRPLPLVQALPAPGNSLTWRPQSCTLVHLLSHPLDCKHQADGQGLWVCSPSHPLLSAEHSISHTQEFSQIWDEQANEWIDEMPGWDELLGQMLGGHWKPRVSTWTKCSLRSF